MQKVGNIASILELDMCLGYDDVFIFPQYSEVESRQDVNLETNIGRLKLRIPIISANMKTVTGNKMCSVMHIEGGLGIMHRFCSIQENIAHVKRVEEGTIYGVSVGLGDKEFERAEALYDFGAEIFCIDVAHGAQLSVVNQLKRIREKFKSNVYIIVGNFATGVSAGVFLSHLQTWEYPDCIKVGISNGSACTTRMQTGVGVPQFSSLLSCKHLGIPFIADGGIKHAGDIAKAIGAGASAVMIGRLLAGTDESPGKVIAGASGTRYKAYSGSASKESYKQNGKTAAWRASEGVSYKVPYAGPVGNVVQELTGGLRSTFTYVGADNVDKFRKNIMFGKQTLHGWKEGTPHGKIL